MELKFGEQVTHDELIKIDSIDLMIYAKNHETRSNYFNKKVSCSINVEKTIILCYKAQIRFKKNEFLVKSNDDLIKILDQFFDSVKDRDNSLNIIVDYSCMTKSWYYVILQYVLNKDISFDKLNLYFIYTPACFSKPKTPKYNTEIGPLPGKLIIPNNKPNALIVCLGYEENKAEGIIDHLDPKQYYLFYSKPSLDPKFVYYLELNNDSILKSSNNVVTYPFDDLLFLERELTSIYNYLKNDYNIIIAPLGPKPFTLVSMLMSIKYPDIDIWRVGSGNDINEYKQKPIENSEIIMKVLFANN